MLSPSYFISPNDLWHLIGTPNAPQLVDVRRREIYESTPGVLPGAIWQRADRIRPLGSDARPRPAHRRRLQGGQRDEPDRRPRELRGAGYDAAMLEGG